ncbi:MAG: MFS transporter [Carbonactinosporaceae bacterium]
MSDVGEALSSSPRVALGALCVTEVMSWGVLYYTFPVALSAITADTGWSATAATAAFSGGLVASAVVGIPVGRWLDRFGPRRVMTAGSVLAVPATLALAAAPTLAWFAVAWVAAGVAMSGVLYPPAFAALTRWYGDRRTQALTVLTLAGGLAGTIFAPLTSALLEHFSWRATYVMFAVVLGVVTVPAHALLLDLPWPRHRHDEGPRERHLVRAVVRGRPFLTLVTSMTAALFALFATSLTLIPLLTERGFSHSLAALAFGLIGAGQLLGRIAYRPLTGRLSPRAGTSVILAAGAGAVGLLAALTGPPLLLIAAAVLLGVVRGAATLLQATAVADRWGTRNYGTLSGVFAAPITAAIALAPWAGAALAAVLGSHPAMFTAFAVLALAASALSATEPTR